MVFEVIFDPPHPCLGCMACEMKFEIKLEFSHPPFAQPPKKIRTGPLRAQSVLAFGSHLAPFSFGLTFRMSLKSVPQVKLLILLI